MSTATTLAAAAPPAGGAAIDQVVGLSAVAAVVSVALVVVAWLHRTGRITILAQVADACGRRSGKPGWVALPLLLVMASLITALFGFLWDVSLHIGRGRDEGPLANPAHYFILVGLFLLFIAGMLAIVLPLGVKPGPASVRITRDWHAPVGGILLAGAGMYALIGFPLDDIWHRIFGQDVTLWGPTHLMLIGGAGFSLFGSLVLEREGEAQLGRASRLVTDRRSTIIRASALGGLLIGLSVFQAEFDFGVAQFRMVLQPMMITGAAALALVAARLLLGRGGALAAALFFLLVRGVVSVLVGPVLGEPTVWFPLYLGEAVVIELLALSTMMTRRPLAFGAAGGFLVATVGMATEALWMGVAFPFAWTSDMWVEGLAMAIPVGVAAGLVGALFALALRGRLPRPGIARAIMVGACLTAAAATTNGLLATVPPAASATIQLTESGATIDDSSGPDRFVEIEATLNPRSLVGKDATWVQVTAWQGGGTGLVLDTLERTGDGTYRSTKPIPVSGTWKTTLRVQDSRMLSAVPIYLPRDDAIGAEEVPAKTSFSRPFQPEIELLQRERKLDHPTWLWTAANLVVLLFSIALIWSLSWGVARVGRATGTRTRTEAEADDRPPALV